MRGAIPRRGAGRRPLGADPLGADASGHRVSVIDDPAAVAALGPAWDALVADHPAVMARHAVVMAALEALHPGDRPHVVTVWRGDRLVAAAPLVRHRLWGSLARLELAGARALGEATLLPATDAEAWAVLLDALRRAPWPVRLARLVADDTPLPPGWAIRVDARGLMLRRPAPPACSQPMVGGWEAVFGRLSAKRRRTLASLRRKAEARGTVTFTQERPPPERVAGLLEAAMAVEAASWKGRTGTAMRDAPGFAAFFRALAESLAREGRFWIAFLSLDGRPMAMEMGAIHADRLWVMKCGYDEAFADLSPGQLLTMEAMRACHLAGLAAYEPMGQIDAAKAHWRPDAVPTLGLRVYPWRPGALLVLAAETGGRAAKALARRIPASAG